MSKETETKSIIKCKMILCVDHYHVYSELDHKSFGEPDAGGIKMSLLIHRMAGGPVYQVGGWMSRPISW